MARPPYTAIQRAQLNHFASAVWGNSGAVLKRSGNIKFIDLEPYPVLKAMFAGPVSDDKILIREEYRIALQELETTRYSRGAYVTGQPGIGKTLFLVYVLVVRLGQKRPVAIQLPDGRQYYALFHESASFHPLDDPEPLETFSSLWALTDSNKQVESPSGLFLGQPHIHVIQATSPRKTRWKEWSKQTGAKCYVMDIWSKKEIVNLAKLRGLDAERMRFLAKEWGCVPRTLLQFMSDDEDDLDIEELYRESALAAVLQCNHLIPAIAQNAQFDDAPSQIFFCRPRISNRSINRRFSRPTVPTPTIRRLLGEVLQDQSNDIKLQFFNALRQSSDTSQAASTIFENWFHSFFHVRNTIQCTWVQGRDGVSPLTGIPSLTSSNWGVVKVEQPPYYWIPHRGFHGVDSVLVLATEIYAFQVTISPSPTHKSPSEGMEDFQNHLPTGLKKTPWRVVFVGDKANVISAVANKWIGKISSPVDGTSVPIAWSAVDPVNPIIYKELREESVESDDESDAAESDDAVEVAPE